MLGVSVLLFLLGCIDLITDKTGSGLYTCGIASLGVAGSLYGLWFLKRFAKRNAKPS